jgi:hypothetical protein
MAQFVLLVSGDDVFEASASELGRRTTRQAEWVARLRPAGVLRDGGRIDSGAIRVRTRLGGPAVIDVPSDSLGSVRLWLLVDAADLDAAVMLAESCPEVAHGAVRVLPVDG